MKYDKDEKWYVDLTVEFKQPQLIRAFSIAVNKADDPCNPNRTILFLRDYLASGAANDASMAIDPEKSTMLSLPTKISTMQAKKPYNVIWDHHIVWGKDSPESREV